MRKRRMSKIGLRISLAIFVVELFVFIMLFSFISNGTSSTTEESAVNNMKVVALDRSEIIKNYVQTAESSLSGYLKAGQIYDMLEDTSDVAAKAKAQKYTEEYGKDLSNLEGIYASTWGTEILVHTNPKVAGQVTRPDEAKRKQLHDAMLAVDGVYNTGIIISPASGEQIISMYQAVKDENGNPIGLGGIGIFTSGLVEKLNELPLEGMKHAQYYLVNMATGEYIFHPDSEKIATIAEEQFVKDIIDRVKNKAKGYDSLRYTEGEKEMHLKSPAMLTVLPWQDWVAMDGELRRENPNDERINVPANSRHYWRYRMHMTLEELLDAENLNKMISQKIAESGR